MQSILETMAWTAFGFFSGQNSMKTTWCRISECSSFQVHESMSQRLFCQHLKKHRRGTCQPDCPILWHFWSWTLMSSYVKAGSKCIARFQQKSTDCNLQQFKDPTEVPKLWSSGFCLSIVRSCNMFLPLLASAQQRLAHEFPGSWKQTENSDGFAGGSYHQIQHDQ